MSFDAVGLEDLLRDLRAGAGPGFAAASRGLDDELPREERRDLGAYFTPAPLVRFAVERAVDALFSRRRVCWQPDGTPDLRVLDPAAGDGRFLAAAAQAIAARCPARLRRDRTHAELTALAMARCVALERSASFAAACRERLPGADVREVEALLGAGDVGDFDLVVGNPPYVRSIRLGESDAELREQLRGRYRATSYGEWDLYTAFIEQTVAWLAPGGEAALIVPSRWLTAQSARELRRSLADARSVRGVVEFGAEQLFASATTYACVVFLTTERCRTISVARLRGERFDVGSIEASAQGESPWRISVGRGRRLVETAGGARPALGELARIAKGTGTNADRVYIVERGDDCRVEAELVHACYRGRDVAAYGGSGDAVRCIVPYRASGGLIAPSQLLASYPRAMEHFERHRERLEARERGRFRGDAFYQFGRPQNLALLLGPAPKVIVPDVAREGRALLDRAGALVLDSAYAVVPRNADHSALLLAVLNSAIVGLWLRETGVPLRGGYVRMKTAYLESLPIPSPGSAAAVAISSAVTRGAGAGEIDGLVRDAYEVAASDWSS